MTDDGIAIPADLHQDWREVQATRQALQSTMDSILARQALLAEREMEVWRRTTEALSLDPRVNWSANIATMKVYRVGSGSVGAPEMPYIPDKQI